MQHCQKSFFYHTFHTFLCAFLFALRCMAATDGIGDFPKVALDGPYAAPVATAEFDFETEEKLDMWWAHKKDKDFVKADRIRADLRKMGIEPEQLHVESFRLMSA